MSRIQPGDDELALHDLFRALRDQTVRVASGLVSRVQSQLDMAESERLQAPSVRGMLGDALVEFINVFVGIVHPGDSQDEGDDQ